MLTTQGTNRPSAHRRHPGSVRLGWTQAAACDWSSTPWNARRLSAYRQHPWRGPARPGRGSRPGRGPTALGREPPVSVSTAPLGAGRPVRLGWAGGRAAVRTGARRPGAPAACRRTDSTPWRGQGRPETATPARLIAQGTSRPSAYRQHHSTWTGRAPDGDGHPEPDSPPKARAARQRTDSTTRRGPACSAGLGGSGRSGRGLTVLGASRPSAYRQHPLAWAGPAGDGHPGQAHLPGHEPPVGVTPAPR